MCLLANSETHALTAAKDIPVFVTEEMRKFYAASGQVQGSTVVPVLVPLKYWGKKF